MASPTAINDIGNLLLRTLGEQSECTEWQNAGLTVKIEIAEWSADAISRVKAMGA